MPAYPTIIIGVGTSGLRVIEQMQRFQYFTGNIEQKVSEVRYVYIETDPGTKEGPLLDETHTRSVVLKSDYPTVDYEQLKKQGGSLDWIPVKIKDGNQAGPIRAANAMPGFGRFVLRVRFDEALTAINGAIQDATEGAEEINREESKRTKITVNTPDPVVFITGTIMGGTGSGLFIDVACMVRHLKPQVHPIGLFMLPANVHTQAGNPDAVAYANAYGALTALSLFDETSTEKKPAAAKPEEKGSGSRTQKPLYREMFPGRGEVKQYESPFKLVQLISATPRTGGTISVESFRKVAALYLYVNRKGYIRKWLERIGEAIGNDNINQYGTFGLSGVQFPKDDITSYTAHVLTQKLMGRWFHPTDYFSSKFKAYRPIASVEAELNEDFIEELFIDSATRRATVLLQIRQNFGKAIEDIVKDIQNPNTKIPNYLAKKFGEDSPDGLYPAVGSMVRITEDELIGLIAKENRSFCQKYESITMAEKALVRLGKRMGEVASFWRTQGAENWEIAIKTAIENFPGHPKIWEDAGQRATIQRERLETLFVLLTKHHLLATLDSIGQYVQEENPQVKKKVKDGPLLPYQGLYTKIQTEFTPVLASNPTTEPDQKVNLAFQQERIYNEVHDPNVPFERVYPPAQQGEENVLPFVREVNRAVAMFESEVLKAPSGNQPSYRFEDLRRVLEKAPTDLWDLLNAWTSKEAYTRLIVAYEKLLRNQDCVQSYDVAGHLLEDWGTLHTIAKRAAEPLLHIRPDVPLNRKNDGSKAMKVEKVKVVMGADADKLTQLLQKLNAQSVSEFPDDVDQKVVVADMQNFVFFFKQFANISPRTDLADASALEKIYRNGSLINPEPDPAFERLRTAYFPVTPPLALPLGRKGS